MNTTPTPCPQGDKCWSQDPDRLTEPCVYGHFDCSFREGGPCMNEHTVTMFHEGDNVWDDEPTTFVIKATHPTAGPGSITGVTYTTRDRAEEFADRVRTGDLADDPKFRNLTDITVEETR